MRWLHEFLRRVRRRGTGPPVREPVAKSVAAAVPGRVPERLIVGLGNPGDVYRDTRHNVGFRIVARLGERHAGSWRADRELDARVCGVEIAGRTCLLLQPQTFMNRSGASVAAACARWPSLDPAQQLLVVYDDLDLPPGRIRLRPGGGAGGHRGIADILAELETRDVPRLRFGVGHPGASAAVKDWVLSPFAEELEAQQLPDSIERAADAVEAAIRDGVRVAMGQFNAAD